MTRIDPTAAWQWATHAIATNREVLLALAGVFLLLPGLAIALFAPQPPQLDPALAMAAKVAALQAWYLAMLPWAIPATLLETAGLLAILTLITDRRRPTVRDAIGAGFLRVLTYVGAQMIVGMGIGIAGSLLAGLSLGLAGLSGSRALIGVVVVALVGALGWVLVRLVLLAPVIAIEQVGNPLRALARSWRLTRGNGLRLFGLLALLGVVALIVMMAGVGVIGSLAAMALGAEDGKTVGSVVEAVLTAAFWVYFAALLAALHAQLAGPAVEGDWGR